MKKNRVSFYFVTFLALIYFVSQFNRASLGAIPEMLIIEFSINNEQLGRLGGIFFLSFALVQIPVGILLDRFNPLKVILVMLLFILLGTLLLFIAKSYKMLILARILQGIGCGVCLMGPLVIIARCFSKNKFSQYSGYVMGLGGLGALFATKPFYLITLKFGWRFGFLITACFILLLTLYILYFLIKSKNKFYENQNKPKLDFSCYLTIFSNRNFLLMLPMSIFGYASFAFLLTLWGNRYLLEIQRLKGEQISEILMLMALFWTIGSIFYGYLEKKFKKKNIVIISTCTMILLLFVLGCFTNLSLINNYIIFSFIGFTGAYTLIVISHYRVLFKEAIIGKVLTAANLFNFGGVFFIQWFTGFIIHIFVDNFNFQKQEGFSIAFLSVILFLLISTFLYSKTDNV